MKPEDYFSAKFEDLRKEFIKNDYLAFFEALMLCHHERLPLPDWVFDVVLRQAEKASLESIGRGRQGNWPAAYRANRIDERRATLAQFHLQARRRQGRGFVSELGRLYDYGTLPDPDSPVHVVTRDDIFEFVSKQLRGTPAQGSRDAVKGSYEKWKKSGLSKRKRTRRGGK